MAENLSFYIIAGETSGDQHGALLMKELKKLNPGIAFYGVGGQKMEEHGLGSLYPIKKLSVMGFWEVIKNIVFFKQLEKDILQDIKRIQPNRVILIDYPGMNLRLAKKIKQMMYVPITYYIAPQVWAWREKRVEILRNYTDQRLVIFPFEEDWFSKRNLSVNFVGYPFFDEWTLKKRETQNAIPILALFPGSRIQEIQRHLSIFLTAAKLVKNKLPDIRIVLGLAPCLSKELLGQLPEYIDIETEYTQALLEKSDAAIIASGTATVEAAIFNVPSVIVYKSSFLSWYIAKLLIKTPSIGMANLIAGKKVFPEYLQYSAIPINISDDIISMLCDNNKSNEIKIELTKIREKLGGPGASKKAANLILSQH